eukprot:UC4_evm1s415
MHNEKRSGDYELVYNETVIDNIVAGGQGEYPKVPGLDINVSSNYNSTNGSYAVQFDRNLMTITMQNDLTTSKICDPDGPGSDAVFTGNNRSKNICFAGPLASYSAANVSLWQALLDN